LGPTGISSACSLDIDLQPQFFGFLGLTLACGIDSGPWRFNYYISIWAQSWSSSHCENWNAPIIL